MIDCFKWKRQIYMGQNRYKSFVRDRSFSTYTQFSKKLTFLSSCSYVLNIKEPIKKIKSYYDFKVKTQLQVMKHLTHFIPLVFFYTPGKHQKISGILIYFQGKRPVAWIELILMLLSKFWLLATTFLFWIDNFSFFSRFFMMSFLLSLSSYRYCDVKCSSFVIGPFAAR